MFITHKLSSQDFRLKTVKIHALKRSIEIRAKIVFQLCFFNCMPMVWSFSSQGIKAILRHIFEYFWRVIF